MAKKKRQTREEIIEEILRTDETFRRLKDRIDYYDRRERERRASS